MKITKNLSITLLYTILYFWCDQLVICSDIQTKFYQQSCVCAREKEEGTFQKVCKNKRVEPTRSFYVFSGSSYYNL